MPTKEVTIAIETDGVVDPGFPIIRKYAYEQEMAFNFDETNQENIGVDDLRILPGSDLFGNMITGAFITGDQQFHCRFESTAVSQTSNGYIQVNANGFVLALGANLLQEETAVLYMNTAAATNQIKGLLIGDAWYAD